MRLTREESNMKKQREEAVKKRKEEEDRARAQAVAQIVSAAQEPELDVPEAAKGQYTYQQLVMYADRSQMRKKGIRRASKRKKTPKPHASVVALPSVLLLPASCCHSGLLSALRGTLAYPDAVLSHVAAHLSSLAGRAAGRRTSQTKSSKPSSVRLSS